MKILMVNKFHFRFGGAETYYFGLSDQLRKAGHSVIPFAMRHPRNEETEYSEFFVRNIDFERKPSALGNLSRGFSTIYSMDAKRKIGALIRKTRPDLVHIHNYNFQITPSILSEVARYGIPVVHTLHDPQIVCPHHRLFDYATQSICESCKGLRFHHAIKQKCIKGSRLKSAVGAAESILYHALGTYRKNIDLFISPSRFLRDKIREMGFIEGRIEVLPNFVDGTGIPDQVCYGDYCLYIGRVSQEKGVDTLVKAFLMQDKGKLVIAGDGPSRAQLEAAVPSHSLQRVVFKGHLNRHEVQALLAGAAFTAVPSLWYENLPLSVMESLMNGKAVIATASGGLTEMIEHGKTGLLFPQGDVSALTACLNQLFNSPELQRTWGRAGRDFAERVYSKDAHVEKILALYESVGAHA